MVRRSSIRRSSAQEHKTYAEDVLKPEKGKINLRRGAGEVVAMSCAR